MQNLKLIDAHAHLNFPDFDVDREEVIGRIRESELGVVNIGTDLATSKAVVDLAKKYPEFMRAIVGLHPAHDEEPASTENIFNYQEYLALAQQKEVVGIGECGLDYFHLGEETKNRQKEIFVQHIKLAKEVAKPLMLHIRSGKGGASAYQDVLEILKNEPSVTGDVHFFAGTAAEAQSFLDLGFYLSFTGVITFASEYEELVRFVPLDRILVETDCPYVAPAPYRGKRNEPAYVIEVARAVARIKGLPFEAVCAQIVLNWQALFGHREF